MAEVMNHKEERAEEASELSQLVASIPELVERIAAQVEDARSFLNLCLAGHCFGAVLCNRANQRAAKQRYRRFMERHEGGTDEGALADGTNNETRTGGGGGGGGNGGGGGGPSLPTKPRTTLKYYVLPNGALHGPFDRYNQENVVIEHVHYENGKRVGQGVVRQWGPEAAHAVPQWQGGGSVLHLLAQQEAPSGEALHRRKRARREWHRNGNLFLSVDYREGKRHGQFSRYYASGSLHRRFEMQAGLLHGQYVVWHPNGRVHIRASCCTYISCLHERDMLSSFDGYPQRTVKYDENEARKNFIATLITASAYFVVLNKDLVTMNRRYYESL